MREKKAPLNKYMEKLGGVGMARPKKKKPRKRPFPLATEARKRPLIPHNISPLARHLWQLYMTAKRLRFGTAKWQFVEEFIPKVTVTGFEKLAKRIRRYLRDAGITINVTDWIHAHLDFYGQYVYPFHLDSGFSFDLYLRYQEKKYAEVHESPVEAASPLQVRTHRRVGLGIRHRSHARHHDLVRVLVGVKRQSRNKVARFIERSFS